METEVALPKRHGLAVLADLFVAPNAAFAELAARAHWGWALLLTCIVGTLAAYLHVPASEHAAAYVIAHDPRFATMSPDQIESAKKITLVTEHFSWLFYSVIVSIGFAFTALVALVANAIGKGSTSYAKLFALAANVGFINFGIGYLVHAIIVIVRGSDNFASTSDLLGVLPSLGWLVPAGAAKLQAFFDSFNVFQIWSTVLLALGIRTMANISAPLAWGASILLAVAGAALAAANVH